MPKHSAFFTRLHKLDAHHRLIISILIAAAIGVVTKNFTAPFHVMIIWVGYAITTLAFSWITIIVSHPSEVKKLAGRQDSSRTLVFFFVVIAALVSMFAIIILLKSAQGTSKTYMQGYILVAILSVFCSWVLVHTVFTLRYAHMFYNNPMLADDAGAKDGSGLDFPATKDPDYLDFVYFSFVIGMTFQVSDVQITCRKIRRLVIVHGLLSFIFNTVIVALTINIISTLVEK